MTPSDVVRSLGFQQVFSVAQCRAEPEATSESHRMSVLSSYPCLRQICQRIDQEAALWLVLIVITSWLDYCNAIVAWLPASATVLLQRVQNAAARLIFSHRPRDHVTHAVIHLISLPMLFRVS